MRRWTSRRARAALRLAVREFGSARPGERFQVRYHRRRKDPRTPRHRAAILATGVAIIAVGVVLLPAPGPGTLVIAFGVALLAGEALLLARLLDTVEVRLRSALRALSSVWRRSSMVLRVAWVVVAFGALAALGTLAVHVLLER